MDTLYSALLAISAALLFLAIVAGGLSIAGRRLGHVAAISFAVSALVADAASFFVHLFFGHGPQSVQPQSLPEFLREHESFLVIAFAATALIVFLVWWRARKTAPAR